MICERIFNHIAPQMKILNIAIPILMHFCSLVSNWSVENCIKLDVIRHIINDIKQFPTIYRMIYCRNFLCYPNRRLGNTKVSALESINCYLITLILRPILVFAGCICHLLVFSFTDSNIQEITHELSSRDDCKSSRLFSISQL